MFVRLRNRCTYCGSYVHYNRGTWTQEEDMQLIAAVHFLGESEWSDKPRAAGIQRCGLNCRNHWFFQIRPDIIDPNDISPEEEERLLKLRRVFGNNWPAIADLMPGRNSKWVRHRYLALMVRTRIMLGGIRVVQAQDHQQLNLELSLRPPPPPSPELGPSTDLHLHSF